MKFKFLFKLQIIKAIYEVPASITPFVYQVIAMSTNVNDPSTVYLLDEGLELWLVVIQYAPSSNDDLLKLCDNLLPIIGKLCACAEPEVFNKFIAYQSSIDFSWNF